MRTPFMPKCAAMFYGYQLTNALLIESASPLVFFSVPRCAAMTSCEAWRFGHREPNGALGDVVRAERVGADGPAGRSPDRADASGVHDGAELQSGVGVGDERVDRDALRDVADDGPGRSTRSLGAARYFGMGIVQTSRVP